MSAPVTRTSAQEGRRRRSVVWVVLLGFLGLVFDGYDLVVYGAVLPVFLRDPSQLGPVTPALGGALGSYALVGVLVGALLAGAVSDVIGRRKLLLTAYAWLSLAMAWTASATSVTSFGVGRFLAGLGIGCLLATTGALISEVAPPGRKNLYNALTYSGIAVGSLLSALVAILALDTIGWRGMFLVGAVPLVTLLPLALVKMPESTVWLLARGRVDEARDQRVLVDVGHLDRGVEPGRPQHGQPGGGRGGQHEPHGGRPYGAVARPTPARVGSVALPRGGEPPVVAAIGYRTRCERKGRPAVDLRRRTPTDDHSEESPPVTHRLRAVFRSFVPGGEWGSLCGGRR